MAKKAKVEPVPKLTYDEFMYAWVEANAAAAGKLPVEIPKTVFNIEGFGKLRLGDQPMTRGFAAIYELFRDDRDKARAAAFRIMLMGTEVLRSAKAAQYCREVDGQQQVASPILEAIATVSASYPKPPPVSKVIALADRIARRYEEE